MPGAERTRACGGFLPNMPWAKNHCGHKERAIYVAAGAVEIAGGRYATEFKLVRGSAAPHALSIEQSTVMVLGGEPLANPAAFNSRSLTSGCPPSLLGCHS